MYYKKQTCISKPLEGIRILDLTQFVAGAYCTMIFSGLGTREDLANDDWHKDQPVRIERTDEVDAIINAWSEKKYVKDVIIPLATKGIPCSQVREVQDVLSDKNLLDLGTVVPIIHPDIGEVPSFKAADMPIRFSLSKKGIDQPAPQVGQNNSEIYGNWLWLKDKMLAELIGEGII